MQDLLTIFFAKYFGYVLLGILAVLWLRNFKKYLPLFWQAAAAAILSRGIITEAIRFFWHRSRPFVEQNLTPLIDHSASASFPSGHASFYFAIGTVLYFYNKKAGMVFLLGATLIGIARVLAGLHWPSDIIGGAIIGIACGILVIQISRKN
ncbi:MAG: Bacitracin transport permease protein BCRC [Parcubacteria group bacterium Greene0714_21]|nr:MAG: Bacitracin transport permease protein BCRC [Parcubacteria group bacterium Greene0416_39]TSC98049.1 MAG: Bacitracin transport permease protein BCRC [Parcubacteria group bacterium Greene1014_47]TSD04160.1 MAG: Bacitracin transport permease protein BCRC [Parcubacteria group bacterium Greene0714_21]